jgi:carboxypeptidase D
MEVGPFRTIPADQTKSGDVELKLVNAGWEEFATIVFSERRKERVAERKADDVVWRDISVDQPPGTGFSTVPTNGYLHELDQVSGIIPDLANCKTASSLIILL